MDKFRWIGHAKGADLHKRSLARTENEDRYLIRIHQHETTFWRMNVSTLGIISRNVAASW